MNTNWILKGRNAAKFKSTAMQVMEMARKRGGPFSRWFDVPGARIRVLRLRNGLEKIWIFAIDICSTNIFSSNSAFSFNATNTAPYSFDSDPHKLFSRYSISSTAFTDEDSLDKNVTPYGAAPLGLSGSVSVCRRTDSLGLYSGATEFPTTTALIGSIANGRNTTYPLKYDAPRYWVNANGVVKDQSPEYRLTNTLTELSEHFATQGLSGLSHTQLIEVAYPRRPFRLQVPTEVAPSFEVGKDWIRMVTPTSYVYETSPGSGIVREAPASLKGIDPVSNDVFVSIASQSGPLATHPLGLTSVSPWADYFLVYNANEVIEYLESQPFDRTLFDGLTPEEMAAIAVDNIENIPTEFFNEQPLVPSSYVNAVNKVDLELAMTPARWPVAALSGVTVFETAEGAGGRPIIYEMAGFSVTSADPDPDPGDSATMEFARVFTKIDTNTKEIILDMEIPAVLAGEISVDGATESSHSLSSAIPVHIIDAGGAITRELGTMPVYQKRAINISHSGGVASLFDSGFGLDEVSLSFSAEFSYLQSTWDSLHSGGFKRHHILVHDSLDIVLFFGEFSVGGPQLKVFREGALDRSGLPVPLDISGLYATLGLNQYSEFAPHGYGPAIQTYTTGGIRIFGPEFYASYVVYGDPVANADFKIDAKQPIYTKGGSFSTELDTSAYAGEFLKGTAEGYHLLDIYAPKFSEGVDGRCLVYYDANTETPHYLYNNFVSLSFIKQLVAEGVNAPVLIV